MSDYQIFDAGNVRLQCGEDFHGLKLAYKTYGTLNADRSNAILYPTSFGAKHFDIDWLIREGAPLDPARYFIIIPNLFGNGLSSSPSNVAAGPYAAKHFPLITLSDNVHAQQRLVREVFGIRKLAMVYGYSMGGQQALHWGALYPDMVERVCAICATARTAPHTWVMFEGVKAALTGDPAYVDGWFAAHPERGLKAMGRVYAGWGFSQSFYRQALYRHFNAATLEEFLVSHWEARFLKRNGNDLLAMIATVQAANLGADPAFATEAVEWAVCEPGEQSDANLRRALQQISARTLLMPSQSDFYFQVEDVRREAEYIRNVELCPIPSVWGHRAGNPQTWEPDANFIFGKVRQLLDS